MPTTCVAERLKQRELNKRDERKSSGVVAWAFGSPSFVRTWMQRQCGWTELQVMICRARDQEGHEEIRCSLRG